MPLRTSQHIDHAIKYENHKECGVFSAVEYDAPVSFAFSIDSENSWSPLLNTSPMITGNTRSQEQVNYYHPNGAIYIKSLQDMRKHETCTFYQDSLPFLMKKSESVDIDTEFDFYLAERLLNNLNKEL
jgi:CMP-N,N'-diacetyllegionaminic acid synthase